MILMKQIITKSVVGVDQKILKKPEVKGFPMFFGKRVFKAKLIAPR
mgnify:CR=1 FL=1